MRLGQRMALERIAGVMEGLASGESNKEMQDCMIQIVEQIDQLLLEDGEDMQEHFSQ